MAPQRLHEGWHQSTRFSLHLQEKTKELKTLKNILDLNNKKKYPEWRKKLDNDFLVPNLVIDGNNWSSVRAVA